MATKKRKFYDIVTKSGTKCTILLYGYIGHWDDVKAQDVTQAIIEASTQYQDIEVRINSMGGEVFEAIAIFNTLRLSTSNVTIFIDGIAASAASIIASCGKPVYMGKYAQIMIHEASGGCYGNKHEMQKCVNELTNLDDQICQIYADKCGKTKDEIQKMYFDGEDHWLTAQQALDMKLIEGLFDMDQVDGTPQQRYTTIYNRLENQRQQPQKKEKNMFYQELATKDERFKDCKSDDEALRIINGLGSAKDVAGKDADIARLKAENDAYKNAEKARVDAAKKTMLDAAEKDGRINADTRKTYEAVLDKDFENGKAILESLKPTKKVEDVINRDNGGVPKLSPFAARMEQISHNYYNNK